MKNPILLMLVALLLLNCQQEKVSLQSQYPAVFEPYVQKFLAEGKSRGYNMDLKGLKIYLRDSIPMAKDSNGILQNYEAYYQPSEHAIYFRTNGYNWNSTREEVFMHEMGHAILKREHRFDRFPDFDAQASVMGCPCPTAVSGWTNLDHQNRETYYYDELFNPSTPEPLWAKE